MPGGAYSALSGMLSRLDQLDRIAADLANVNTSGYKTERTATNSVDRPSFSLALDAAVDVVDAGTKIDLRSGTIASTGRDLDVALDGSGFFVVGSAQNPRYTRSGNFVRRADGLLTTAEGESLLDEQMRPIKVGEGKVTIDANGAVMVGDTEAATLKLANFAEKDLVRESGARFRTVKDAKPIPMDAKIVAGSLEQANVSSVDRMVALTGVSRSFQALQRGISTLHDMDGMAITQLGRRG
jgi:flagellar basal-body rod protein FlgF